MTLFAMFETFAQFVAAAVRGEALVDYSRIMRKRTAQHIRHQRGIVYRVFAPSEIDRATLLRFQAVVRQECHLDVAHAHVRLESRRDILRRVRNLRVWANEIDATLWSLPCGADDHASDVANAYRREATDLLAYLRVQRARGIL